MFARIFAVVFFLFSATAGLFAQETLKTLNLSASEIKDVPGTPRIVRNAFQHVWLSAWRQQGAPSKIFGRVVTSTGTTKSAKVLASGVTSFDQNFDIFYDSVNYTYLLAFETAKGLQVQLFNGNLGKVGAPSLIEGDVSDTYPRLAFDSQGETFLITWFSTQGGAPRKVLKSRLLDVAGKPAGDSRTLATTQGTFETLSLSTNQKTRNLIAIVLQLTGSTGKLLGYNLKPDGSLLKATPIVFQQAVGLNTVGDASFTNDGTGFGFWSFGTSVRYRRLSAAGGFASAAKSIAGAADSSSTQTSILFDSANNQFIGTWGKGNAVMGVALNSAGAIIKKPFSVASSSVTASINTATSYDASVGNAIVVWDDSTGTASKQFRPRAAIFFVSGSGGSSTTVSVGDNFFSPADVRVATGGTITWTFDGNNQHTATSGNGSPSGVFDSGNRNKGDSFSFRFTTAGSFQYFCKFHGAGIMSGTVTVTGGGEPPPKY